MNNAILETYHKHQQ